MQIRLKVNSLFGYLQRRNQFEMALKKIEKAKCFSSERLKWHIHLVLLNDTGCK